MVQRVLGRLAENVSADPLAFWLSRVDFDTRPAHRSHFLRWMKWLQTQPSCEHVMPRELLIRQLETGDPYVVLDLLQTYVGGLILRKSSKRKAYSVVRSFFGHNRCGLPVDRAFRIRGDRPPVEAKLTVLDVQEAALAASVRYRSLILFKWQSMLDNERLIRANLYCAEQVVKQIQMGADPVRLDLPGRKSNENALEGRFYTFIGKDAVDALTKYFEEERGWPRAGEALWLMPNGEPLTKPALEAAWMRLLRHMAKIPQRKGPVGSRYGYNMHEMRDKPQPSYTPTQKRKDSTWTASNSGADRWAR